MYVRDVSNKELKKKRKVNFQDFIHGLFCQLIGLPLPIYAYNAST